jgi:AraC-like DNA-binding protein
MDQYPRQYLYRRVVRAKLFIDANFASRLDLNDISDEACFSKFHFARLFRDVYGKTPHQYLSDVRIAHARNMLIAGATVAKTCFSVGFDSVSSFTTLFRRRTGFTPAAFQRRAIDKQDEMAKRPIKFVPNCFTEKHHGAQ